MHMTKRLHNLIFIFAAMLLPVLIALGGWALITARSHASGAQQSRAVVALPTPTATSSTGAAAPVVDQARVCSASLTLVVRDAPAANAVIKWRLPVVNVNGYPQLVLVDAVREIDGVTWYDVSVAVRPNGSHGWIREGSLAFYQVTTHIDVNLTQRRLDVYTGGSLVGSFRVGIGESRYPTPTGHFFINQKLRPSTINGPYGVLALGISAFQPKLSFWPQGGPVAIHGTNQPALVGQPVSHGCVRMTNHDILLVSALAPAGTPVYIHK
jgi:lipoprotein-anchoring transpeptidase ErfK/SrfK